MKYGISNEPGFDIEFRSDDESATNNRTGISIRYRTNLIMNPGKLCFQFAQLHKRKISFCFSLEQATPSTMQRCPNTEKRPAARRAASVELDRCV